MTRQTPETYADLAGAGWRWVLDQVGWDGGPAAALAVAGAELDRPDLVAAARSGAEHLVTLGDASDGGFVVPHFISSLEDFDAVTFNWCRGPIGTSLLFSALETARVDVIAGIAAYLFRTARVLREGREAPAVARLDTWWAVAARS